MPASLIRPRSMPMSSLDECVLRGRKNLPIAVGRQIDDNLFVTLSPRLCNVSEAVDLFYPSVEYRLGRYWKFTFSADPAQPCGVLTTRAGDFRTQLGVDVLWDRRY